MKRNSIYFILLTILLFTYSQAIQAEVSIDLDGGLTFLGNSDTLTGALSPIMPTFGLSVPIYFTPYFFLSPGLDLTGTYYLYSGDMAYPAENEKREYSVLISHLDIFTGLNLPLSSKLEWGIGGGASFVLRFPIPETADDTNYQAVLNWFYAEGRFIYPGALTYLKWNLEDDFSLIFAAKGLFPIFHLWAADALPFWDQMFITGRVGFSFPL